MKIIGYLLEQTKHSIKVRLALSLLSGLMLAASWPPSTWNFLLIIAFCPLMLSFFSAKSYKEAFLQSYVAFFIFSNYTMSWFSLITDDYFALILIYLAHILIPLTQSLPWLLSYWLFKKSNLISAFTSLPFFYLSYEIFHYHWDLTYTWIHLGLGFSNSQYFLNLYPYIGQEGGSFYILIANVCLALIVFNSSSFRKTLVPASIFLTLLILPAVIPEFSTSKGNSIKIGVFQPNIDYDEKISNETIEHHYSLLENAVSKLEYEEIEMVICPEGYFKNFQNNPIIINDPSRHNIVQKLQRLSAEKGCAIISGAIVVKLYFTEKAPTLTAKKKKENLFYDTYNSVLLIEPNGNIQWRSKVRLVPFAERVPFLKYIRWLERLHLDFNESLGSYDYEHDPSPFAYKNMRIAPLICYESLYPDVTSFFIERKANVLMEFSNENWTPEKNKGQEQHEIYANINAMQFGRDYIRSTYNKGSSVIKHDALHLQSVKGDYDLLLAGVKISEKRTFYTMTRSLWRWIHLYSLLLIIVVLINQKFKVNIA